MFKSYHNELGILDTAMYDHELVYGVKPGEKKDTKLFRAMCSTAWYNSIVVSFQAMAKTSASGYFVTK